MSSDVTPGERTPLIRPPALNADAERTPTPLELFFDLAYVLVVAELALSLVPDVTWSGSAEFAGLFTIVWFSWMGFTLYANRFDTDDLVFRVAKLASTLAIAGCAASASAALGEQQVAFGICYLAGRVILALLYFRAWWHVPDARSTINFYLFSAVGVALLWAVSLLLPAPWISVLWAVAVLVDVAGPLTASIRRRGLAVNMNHLPDRFGLFVILVLGVVVAGIVNGVHDVEWERASIAVAVAGFVVAAGLWWTYFDVTATVSAAILELDSVENATSDAGVGAEGRSSEPEASHGPDTDERYASFVYGHLPVTLGVSLAGVGIEGLVVHPTDPLPSVASWLLCIGLLGFVLGSAVILGGTLQRWRALVVWPLGSVPLLLGLGAVGGPSSLLFVLLCAVVVVALAAIGTALVRKTTVER